MVVKLIRKTFSNKITQMINGIVEESITSKLNELIPNHLEVTNESYKHNVPEGSESHFKVVIVSSKFEGVNLVKRHQMVNTLLKEEFNNGLHALSIMAKTPEQWTSAGNKLIHETPNCLGGSKK